MTKKDINKLFDIPISTLNEWQKIDSRKNKLYTFLINLNKKDIDNISSPHKYHRLFHILNRNINKDLQYTYDEIKTAFSKVDYNCATQREQLIYSKFFKECESEDLNSLSTVFGVSKMNIKNIYLDAPERSLKGVAKIWDKRFRLKHIQRDAISVNYTPSALQLILNKRILNV
ncbi:MAG: hypothetical protein U9N59_01305 [Campylobacterota bacterium]|nr:hypothetical protein [Campylobacterota bacterium]